MKILAGLVIGALAVRLQDSKTTTKVEVVLRELESHNDNAIPLAPHIEKIAEIEQLENAIDQQE